MIFSKVVEEYEGATIRLHWFRIGRRFEATFEEYSVTFRADTLTGLKAVIDVEISRQQGLTMKKLQGT